MLLTSCASLAVGSKQNITFIWKNDSVKAIVDDNIEVRNNTPVALTRKEKHVLEINADGYENVRYDLKPHFNKASLVGLVWLPAAIVVGVYLASQKETITETGPYGYSNTYSRSKEPQFTSGIMLASFSWAIPMIPIGTDLLSGAAYELPNNIDLKLYSLPTIFKPQEVVNLSVSSVNVKMNAGNDIGGLYSRKGRLLSDYTWSEVNNVAFTDLEVQANNKLNEFGLNISGLRNIEDRLIPKGRNEYLLEAEINELDATTKMLVGYNYETSVKFNIIWRLITPKTGDIVFSKSIDAESFVQSNFNSNAVYKALDHSLYELLADEKFRQLVKSTNTRNNDLDETPNPNVNLSLEHDNSVENKSVKTIANENKDGVVTIITASGHGSGFCISKDGVIVTNAHVVEGVNNIEVKFNKGLSFEAEVLKIDSEKDLALLKVPGNGYQTLRITESKPELGEEIVIIGTPAEEFLEQSISRGIVSGIRLIEGNPVIQTDASISPGNSGGPAFNSKGQVIGVVSSKLVGGGVEGIGFIIPSKSLIELVEIKNK